MATHVAGITKPLSRWDTAGNEWHRHAIEHAHPGGDADHQHLLATDEETLDRLKRLLQAAARGPLTAEQQREAADLLELTG